MPIASVHPMVVGRSDDLALVQDGVPLEIKYRKNEAPVEPTVSKEASV